MWCLVPVSLEGKGRVDFQGTPDQKEQIRVGTCSAVVVVMNPRRSKYLALMLGIAFLSSPLILLTSSPIASATPVVVEEFAGDVAIANLTFVDDRVNRTLAVELPRGATITDASLVLEGRPGLLPKSFQLDFVNGALGKDVWAYHEEDAGIHPPTVDPLKSGWMGAGKKEYMSLPKNDNAYWQTQTNVKQVPPYEWPMQMFHFNPGFSNASSLFISWIGHGFNRMNATNPGHAELWLYNHTGTKWEEVANYSSQWGTDVDLNYTAMAPTPFISANGSVDAIVVGAHSDTQQGRIGNGELYSDYIEIVLGYDPIIQYPYDITLEIGGTNVTTYYDYLEDELVIDDTHDLKGAIQDAIDGEPVFPGDLIIPFNVSVGNSTMGSLQVRDLVIEYEPVVNLPPSWMGPAEVETLEDELWTDVMDLFAVFPDDHNTGALTFQVANVSDPDNLSARIGWDGSNRSLEVQGAPDFFGEVTVKIMATDMFGASSNSTDITVRVLQTADTPRLIDPGPFTVAEGDPVLHVFDVDDPDLPDDVFTFSDSSEWIDIDESTGEISWTPDGTQVGPHRFLVSVVDRFGLSDSINVNIMVTDVNQAPTITSALEIDTVQDEIARYTIRAEDPDVPFGDHISYEAFVDGIVVNVESATGIMSFTPTNDLVPSFEITLRVTDDLGEKAESILLVNVENKNDPPELTLNALLTYDQGDEVAMQLVVIDPDLDLDLDEPETITFETTGPDEMVADQEGWIRFTADQSLVGEHTVVYIVIDGAGARDSITVVFTIIDVNDDPEIILEVAGPDTVNEDEELVLNWAGIDLDGDTLTWSDDSDLVDIDPTTGRIEFTPGQDDVGSYTITITLSDGRGGEDVSVHNIEVVNVNDAPEITTMLPSTGTKVKAGKTITLSSTAFDEDGDTLTYTWKDGENVLGTGDVLVDVKLKSGTRTITLVVDDGTTTSSEDVFITVDKAEEEPGFGIMVAMIAMLAALLTASLRRRQG